ncbi:MAG: cytochrome P450, partial [Pseudomonadota bacterium]
DIEQLTPKVLKAHDLQVKLSRKLVNFGFDSFLGKLLRTIIYHKEGSTMFKAWRAFLSIRQKHLGNTFFVVDNALVHTDHAHVKQLMQVEPQLRGNDIGILKVNSPSYMLNYPVSLGLNGEAHTNLRILLQQALPDPFEAAADLDHSVDRFLSAAAKRGNLHIGKDLPRFMIKILHQLVFDLSLSEADVSASRAYVAGIPLSTLPSFVSRFLLASKTGPAIKYRKQLVARYQTTPKWPSYAEKGEQVGLSPDQIANGLFDMIHIAGTAGTSALMGSVIGLLCLDESLREKTTEEANRVWSGTQPLSEESLRQASVLHTAILETARLYPPVRFVSQLSTAAGEIDIGGQKCPFHKGTRLLGSIFTANHDGNRYEEPETFSLERDFSDLLSWNGGSRERECPGRALSIELIKVVCMHLLKRYQWERFTEVAWDFGKVSAFTPNELELIGFAAIGFAAIDPPQGE